MTVKCCKNIVLRFLSIKNYMNELNFFFEYEYSDSKCCCECMNSRYNNFQII